MKEIRLVEMIFSIIWIHDDNMKIKTDSMRQKQFSWLVFYERH